MLAKETTRSENRPSHNSGSGACNSIHTNAISSASPATAAPTTLAESQGALVPPHDAASRISVMATPRVAAPATSIRCSRTRPPRLRVRITTTSARMPNGRFTRKIHRHEIESVSEPPASGPTIDAVPHMAPTKP